MKDVWHDKPMRVCFVFQAEDGIRYLTVTGVQTCALPISDILGNHTLVFSGAVNGRLSEAQVLAAYINQAHRLNWAIGGSQQPLYFYVPSVIQHEIGRASCRERG